MTKLAALSIDLDEIDCYAAIHGLVGAPSGATAVYDRALDRFDILLEELGVRATFFAIGRDLAREDNRARLRALSDKGHEIANHSFSHHYDLTRRERDVQRAEVVGGADAIEHAVGIRPVGFRAPGYTITDQLFDVLREAGVAYDSSVFPCPPYYALKAAAIGWIRARGRRSHSVLDHPRVLAAPASPYRVGTPYSRRGDGLVELPIGVTPAWSGSLPYIGTSLVSGGATAARLLTELASTRAFVNLELHGIDLADAVDDELGWLAPHQPDLSRTKDEKRARLCEAVSVLKARGHAFVTLSEAARRVP